MEETQIEQNEFEGNYLTPSQIVKELDKYIIGQKAAKKAVAIALRNRWRRQNVEGELQDEIMPNNIIMIGPTGVGKTEIARRLAKLAGAPFVKVEATKFTEVGYVGRDVESMVRELADRSVQMVHEEQLETKKEQAKKNAEDRIIDILVPPVKASASFNNESSEVEDNKLTREKFRNMLHNGVLDEREIEIETAASSPNMQILGPIGLDEMGINLQDLMGQMGGSKKTKKRKLKIVEAIKILEKEEGEKLVDKDAVIKEALKRAQTSGIIFIDEIDKVAARGSSSGSGPEVSREGVQRDLLPIVEGSAVNTKHGPVDTKHILFIASGAFHVSKPSDLIPELQGRFPIRVELNSLTEDDFKQILTIPKNALIKQYTALMKTEKIELTFDESAISEIAHTAAKVNEDVTNIGARRLHTILTTLLESYLFNAPDKIDGKEITINDQIVKDNLDDIAKSTDLSKFIL